jgi:outer membrane protein insertion porin family
MALNYFGNVYPDILDLPTGDVDLVINVEEKPTAQVSAGAGYSGRDKFVGTFGLGIPNFRGLGQYLGINVDVGSRRNSYTLSFTEPWAFSTPTTIGFDLYYTNRDWYSDYTEGRRGGSIRLGRRLRWPDNYSSAFVRYRLEEDRFHNFSDFYIQRNSYRTFYDITIISLDTVENKVDTSKSLWTIIRDPLPNSLLRFNEEWFSSSSLQFTYIRDSRDLPEFSTRGSKLTYSFETTGGFLGGYWKYQKHVLSYSHFIPLFWKVALGAKVTFGAINAPSGDNRILEFDRFSPGGTGFSGVVRGYDDGSLTPDSIATLIDTTFIFDELPDSIGSNYYDSSIDTLTYVTNVRGKYMLVGNFELQLPLIENQLYALAFYDIGNSWLNRRDINFKDLYSGIGLGLRLVVPGVGTIGFDFGNALDAHRNPLGQKDQEGGWKFHFQIGTVFR